VFQTLTFLGDRHARGEPARRTGLPGQGDQAGAPEKLDLQLVAGSELDVRESLSERSTGSTSGLGRLP
jgi:hypothetical protein